MFRFTRRLWAEVAEGTTALRHNQRSVDGGQRLLDVVFPLSRFGLNSRVTRTTWKHSDSFWLVTKIKYNKRGYEEGKPIRFGKVWGTLYWNKKHRTRSVH